MIALDIKPVPDVGICLRCGRIEMICRNDMLCYRCSVNSTLEETGNWMPGMPHPAWCNCVLPEHGCDVLDDKKIIVARNRGKWN